MDTDQRIEPVQELLQEGGVGDVYRRDPLDPVTNSEVIVVHRHSHERVSKSGGYVRVEQKLIELRVGGDPLAQVRDDPSPCLLALVVRELRDSLRGEAELGGLVAQLM